MELPQIHFETDRTRGHWSNKREYLLSCIGAAIGLGNVWRFPYLCYKNGGGAFLLPYLLMLFLCGIPLFYLESCLGQFSSASCLTVFKIAPLFKGVGYAILVVNFISTCYYVVIVSYPLSYIYESIAHALPWTKCGNAWNTNECLQLDTANYTSNHVQTHAHRTPADEFFHNKILHLSNSIDNTGEIIWPLFIFNCITWFIIFLCIMKGVKGVGKVVYVTVTFPILILVVMFVRGITLPGAVDGIYFYIYPEWNKITHYQVWLDAAVQIFFSVGCGWGSIINMASYNHFSNNNKNDAILVPLCNGITSVFAGFVVFSVLGFMSQKTGLPIADVATGGPGLAFVTYPEAIALLPYSQFWSVLFFLMLFLIGLDSCFVPLESMISTMLDEYVKLRKYKMIISFIVCCGMCCCSTIFITESGMYYIRLLDFYAPSLALVTISLCELFIVGWTYGMKNFARDVEFMNRAKLHCWWPFCWRFIAPIILTIIIFTTITYGKIDPYNGVNYPEWSKSLGWTTATLPVFCIPFYMGYKLLYKSEGDLCERLSLAVRAGKKWGPKQACSREEWLYMVYRKRVIKMRHVLEETKHDAAHKKFLLLSSNDTNSNTTHL